MREHARLSMRNWRARNPHRERTTGWGADLAAMEAAQGNRCAICGIQPNGKRLAVDHDHETGRIRGLLCHRCNLALGLLRDDLELVRRAADYLDAP